MNSYLIAIIIGYLFGCLQWSYIFGKVFLKIDIRNLGGGNAGASNTVISLGWRWGVLVAVLDIAKAFFSILLIKHLFKISYLDGNTFLLYLNGLFVIIGHDFPFFMGFKGGKGTASLLGMLIGLDYRLGIIGFFIVLLITLFTNYIVLGTLCLNLFLILSAVYLKAGFSSILISLVIAAFSLYLHIPNIKAIINKTEKKLKDVLKRKSKSAN